MPTYKITDSVFPTCSSPWIWLASDCPAGVGAVFETGAVLFTGVRVELATTAVFDWLEVFVVEMFVVVFPALPQAEKSNANDAMLNVEKVLIFKILIFPTQKLIFLSADVTFQEQMNCMFNIEFQSRYFNQFRIIWVAARETPNDRINREERIAE